MSLRLCSSAPRTSMVSLLIVRSRSWTVSLVDTVPGSLYPSQWPDGLNESERQRGVQCWQLAADHQLSTIRSRGSESDGSAFRPCHHWPTIAPAARATTETA